MSKSLNKSSNNQWLSKLPMVYRGAIILAIPVISILPAIATWRWSSQAKNDAYWWISHTQEVIRESDVLLRVLVDAETGIRGYTISQESEFLEPYNQALVTIERNLQRLKTLTADNPQQQIQLQTIEQQIQVRLNLLKQILEIVESTQQLELLSQSTQLFTNGKIAMDAIRDSIAIFNNEEWRLLNIRQQELQKISRISNILMWVTIVLSLLGYGLAIILYYQSEAELGKQAQKLVNINQILAETNQLLASRNQELDQFTYIVSHDLKAPLRAVANLSEWIEEDLADKLDEDTSKNMALLRNRVQRMDNFINGLLAYSRAGRIKGEKTTVDVQKLLQEIIESIAPPSGFTIKINPGMPILKTKALPLQQVFTNLITNGIKHHNRDDGTIIISVQKINGFYQFSVADDGVGIEPEYQEKIFEVFQTLTARDKQENTGIGLSIVKKIVEQQGGKIWLKSALNKGSTFYFTWRIKS